MRRSCIAARSKLEGATRVGSPELVARLLQVTLPSQNLPSLPSTSNKF